MQKYGIKYYLLVALLFLVYFVGVLILSCMCCFYGYDLGVKYLESGEVGMLIGFFMPTMVAIWAFLFLQEDDSPQE